MPVKELRREQDAVAKRHDSDAELVRDCLDGNEEAWKALVQRYKNLIFSIPLRYGLSRDDAADILQTVFLELLQELPKLREAKALPKWLMQVTAHKCFHWKRQSSRTVSKEDDGVEIPEVSIAPEVELNFREFEEEQMLREAVLDLPPKCQELVRMLFYEEPSRPYQQVAESLGLAAGSIGFLRQKCLDHLRKRLGALGF